MTLVRTLVWFVVAAVVMFAAVWLAERPGSITAEWHGWRLDTNVGVMMIVLVVLILLSVGSWLLYRWIAGAPGALFDTWGESKRRRGYQALTQGLAAVAAGDGAEAQKNARKAEALLSEPPLTLLLSAQAAQLTGDRDGAKRAFNAMLEDEQMAFLGLRGLIAQSLHDGDQGQALAYAERAFKLRPQTQWVVHSLIDMQAQIGRWREAQDTLDAGLRRKVVTADKGRTLKARRYLDAAGGANPPVRVCRLMAEVEERAQSDQAKVHEWLARAATAPADKAWRCSACGAHHEAWHSVCESCGAFGTLHWRAPGTYGHILPPEVQPKAVLQAPLSS